jgi:hypothetical protein
MKAYKYIINKFIKRSPSEYRFIYVEELPNKVNDKMIYIIGNIDQPWLIALNCPCGCQSLIQLNLLKEGDPRWKFRITKKGKINISPSIWKINGCKSHFLIYRSKIEFLRKYISLYNLLLLSVLAAGCYLV